MTLRSCVEAFRFDCVSLDESSPLRYCFILNLDSTGLLQPLVKDTTLTLLFKPILEIHQTFPRSINKALVEQNNIISVR